MVHHPAWNVSDDAQSTAANSCSGELPLGQYQTFVVRLWTDEAEDSLRGHVQHVGSRRGIYFRDVEKMLQFINEHLQPVALPVSSHVDTEVVDGELESPTPEGGEADDR
jgi:hypothetical protein